MFRIIPSQISFKDCLKTNKKNPNSVLFGTRNKEIVKVEM
jgi:hypothetical protein